MSPPPAKPKLNVLHDGSLASSPLNICKIGKASDPDGWAQCQCNFLNGEAASAEPQTMRRRMLVRGMPETVGGEEAEAAGIVRVNCEGMFWTSLANLSGIWGGDEGALWSSTKGGGATTDIGQEQLSHPSVGALSIKKTFVKAIGQDTFRSEPNIHFLDLSANAIESVNANAFRGLEGQLFHLDLSGNRFGQVPRWSLTYLRQLQHFSLRDNRIESLHGDTFAELHLRNLRYLHLDGNKIDLVATGSLASLPLQVLTLSNNRIAQLPNGSLPKQLWLLDLKNNFLSEVPFAALDGLNSLRIIDLERNNITELGTHSMGWLKAELDLRLALNRISRLPEGAFDGFRRFERLDLSHNQINSISEKAFQAVESVSELDLGSNALLQIPQNAFLRFANSLRRLNLEQNKLGELPKALQPLISLQQLNLNGNRIRTLDANALARFRANLSELSLAKNMLGRIPSEGIQGMVSLRSLDLSDNAIESVGKMAFGSFDGLSPSGVSSLQRLSLAGNRIRELTNPGAFIYLSNLIRLDLSHNRIARLTKDVFERLDSLEWLSLDYNKMLEFPRNTLSPLNRLKHLSMEANLLQMLPNYAFQWLVHLQWLSLAKNRLSSINAKMFHSTSAIQIRWLNLANNRISRMETAAFQNLPNLERLYLSHNRLTTLHTQILSSLKNLRQLSLAHNNINTTQESAFANLPHLEELTLAHNRLRTIKEGVFHKVPSLARLDLSHNRIEAFDLDFLGASQVYQLRALDLSFNVIRKLEIQSAKYSLRSLDLHNNQLEFVHGQMFQGFEQLRSVDLSQNDLIDLNAGSFWSSTRLERIVLSENNLRTIWRDTFRDQNLIIELNLAGNVLHSLDSGVFGKDNLLGLDLSRNNFSAIPIRALTSVRGSLSVLKMSRNGVKVLNRKEFEGMKNLNVLELAENRIETLEEEMFSFLPKLKHLDLSGNPVNTWSPHVFLGLSPFTEHLDLSRTGLFSLPKLHKLSSLRYLNLSGNFLYELPPTDTDPLPALQMLDLAKNRLVELRAQLFDKISEVRMLNLSDNIELRSIDGALLKGLGQLEILSLVRMSALSRLTGLSDFAYLLRLRSLEIFSNPSLSSENISQILQLLPPLRSLHFESTDEVFSGRELAKADLRLLRELSITGANIKHIGHNAFGRLRGYRLHLSIYNTQIRHFPPEALNHMNAVTFLRLFLRNNRINTFDPFLPGGQRTVLNERGTVLEAVDLGANPLKCDCRMEWLTEWIAQQKMNVQAEKQWTETKELLRKAECGEKDAFEEEHRRDRNAKENLLDTYEGAQFIWYRTKNGQPFRQFPSAEQNHYDYGLNDRFDGFHQQQQQRRMGCDEDGRRLNNSAEGTWRTANLLWLLALALIRATETMAQRVPAFAK
uniref:Chaoptin n=1 Tax=Globodera rostochiensis TaxID=31243 RepID=A0A914HXV5_GLORO